MAQHLSGHFGVCAYDSIAPHGGLVEMRGVRLTDLPTAAKCPVVILATPVDSFEGTIEAIVPYLQPGALVLDVGSVNVIPAEIMKRNLPEQVEIVATHPLFGPQSARNGIRGLKIAVCSIRGQSRPPSRCLPSKGSWLARHQRRQKPMIETPSWLKR